jgi:hypothetical protein
MVNLQLVVLGAPTSLAGIMVIGPHHAAVTHVGDSSEVAGPAGAHGSARVGRRVPAERIPRGNPPNLARRGEIASHQDTETQTTTSFSLSCEPPPAAGAPPAGPWQEPNWVYSYVDRLND